jgi:hypothetical protein
MQPTPPRFDPSKNFHFGYPGDKIHHWALYEPASKRFLFTSDVQSIDKLQQIRLLCSSRYNLFLCDISTADNYAPNIIDNECCENWSMIGIPGDTVALAAPLFEIDALIPSGSTEIPESAINEQKLWIQFVNYWVDYVNHLQINQWRFINSFIEKMFDIKSGDVLGYDFSETKTILAKKIELELYLGTDIESTENKIMQLIIDN